MSGRLHIPAAYPNDVAADARQRASVEGFYISTTFDSLTDFQASALQDYAEFARAVVQIQAPGCRYAEARPYAEAVAVYISQSREIAEGVVSMMRRRFEKGSSPEGLTRAVKRFEYFEDVEAFCEDMDLPR